MKYEPLFQINKNLSFNFKAKFKFYDVLLSQK